MGDRRRKREQFFKDHPTCCFCGGSSPATTTDHVPPQACFPRGLMPENFEFPACKECNNGTSKHDTVFAFCSMSMDFNEANQRPADLRRMNQHYNEISRRWPNALPDLSKAEPIHRAGHIITPSPVAVSVPMSEPMSEALEIAGEKLAHALYYREMKRIMQPTDRFFTVTMQIQKPGTETMTDYFKRILPDLTMGDRPNIKDYGNRFAYKSGCKPEEGFFVFAAQFGFGMLCWGMVLGPNMELTPANDALIAMKWRQGGSIGRLANDKSGNAVEVSPVPLANMAVTRSEE